MELTDLFNSRSKITKEKMIFYKDIIYPVTHIHIREEDNRIVINTETKRNTPILHNNIVILNVEQFYAIPKINNKCLVVKDPEVYRDNDTNIYLLIANEIDVINVPDKLLY